MKLSDPIGNPVWAAFFIRAGVGGWLLADGLMKIQNMDQTVQMLQQFHVLPGYANTVYAILAPALQVIAGGLVLAGLWTTLAGALACLVLISYILPVGLFPTPNRLLFNKDLLILLSALSLLYSGAGALSVDRFKKPTT